MQERIKVSPEGHLLLGGCDAVQLAETYGTPLYVMDEELIRSSMQAYRRSVEEFYGGRGLVCY
ncbi:MAG: diaminopimelate decarboxylase, partial [Oscillospiraceae bacterium]|nr:diaminopimelate decarboxylase [Oscillospiraceae bacterium]